MSRDFLSLATQIEVGMVRQVQVGRPVCCSIVANGQLVVIVPTVFHRDVCVARITAFFIGGKPREAHAVVQNFPVPQHAVEAGEAAMVGVLPVVFFQFVGLPVDAEACASDAVGKTAHDGSHVELVRQQVGRADEHIRHLSVFVRHDGRKPTGTPVGQFNHGSD